MVMAAINTVFDEEEDDDDDNDIDVVGLYLAQMDGNITIEKIMRKTKTFSKKRFQDIHCQVKN